MDEIDLIKKAQKKDKQAFDKLYEKYSNSIFLFFLSRVNNREDAMDLTSEVFIKVIRHLHGFKFNSSFRTWIYAIAKNILMDFYKEKYKERENISEIEIDNIAVPFKENNIQNKENEVFQLLQKLPSNYRKILEVRYLMGFSILDTAKELNISESNAKVTIHRALQKAREIQIS